MAHGGTDPALCGTQASPVAELQPSWVSTAISLPYVSRCGTAHTSSSVGSKLRSSDVCRKTRSLSVMSFGQH